MQFQIVEEDWEQRRIETELSRLLEESQRLRGLIERRSRAPGMAVQMQTLRNHLLEVESRLRRGIFRARRGP